MKPWVKILLAMAAGLLFGIIFQEQYKILAITGKIFIDLLKMLVGILIFSSVVTGICHISDPRKFGRIGLKAITFFIASTLIAIAAGIVVSLLIQPGSGINLFAEPSNVQIAQGIDTLDFIASLVPSNPFASLAEGNVLQVIVFAVFFGWAILVCGERAKTVSNFFDSVNEVMNTLTGIIMKMAPIGVFALIANSVSQLGIGIILPLGKFLLCNYIACLFQVGCIFVGSIHLLAKMPVVHFFKGMKEAIVLAFSTCSSSATLPVSMKCVRKELGISDDISGFVLSLGCTVNMNGAAIGQVVSCIFIAQAYGVELTVFKLAILVFTALLAAIGIAGIPGQGIVMLSMVLNAVGVPLEGIALVAGVDRLREMVSTVVNILGDAVAAMIIARTEDRFNQEKYYPAKPIKV